MSQQMMANAIRALAMDAVEKAKSGHLGMPMGMADVATVLFTRFLKFDPADPAWPDRDRFVLSAGHGSMLLYSLLFLTGYDLSLEDIKQFRQLHSKTPGHPECTLTPGVEITTGPLGQGFANGVGMGIAALHLAAKFNKKGFPVVDNWIYCICSDGDLMEGVSYESASLAGHLQLSNLIYLYDDNQVTIDGSTGDVYPGAVHGKEVVSPDAETLLGWARELGIAIGAPSSSPTPDRADTADAEAVDPDEVLTTLSIRTISTVDALASAALVSPQALRITLDRLDAEGLISLTSGFVQLTEGGAARADGRRERERGAWGPAAAVEALDRFARLDKEMKDTVTSWQMRTGDGEQRINDHADSNYDAAVLARLATLHADTDRWLGSLTGAPDRMARYRRRLDRAMDAVRGGDVTFVASPQVDSFHTIWFDLHEDLIRLAGRTREDEAAAGRA